MARFRYLILSSLALIGARAASSVLDLIPTNFDEVVLGSGKPALVEFFAPWCGHCKNLAPVWEELAEKFAFASDQVSIAKVDADEHKELGRRFGVQGFPTLKWFDGKSDVPTDYSGGRDLESLSTFITQKTGLTVKTKKTALSSVEMLTDRTFKQQIGGEKAVLVAFTASWCGRMTFLCISSFFRLLRAGRLIHFIDCKSLAPIWETLAKDFKAEPSVIIAKVDATADNAKATAEDQGVESYPTIKYFPKGSTNPENYEGGRSEDEFISFLNTKLGTHRVAGGGLDAKAGTVAALDAIIDKFTAGGNLASISKEATEAVKGLQDTYSYYYIKVLEKLATSQGYAEKELARLESLIKKGGLAPEKLDDLVSRSNILRRFAGKKESIKEEL